MTTQFNFYSYADFVRAGLKLRPGQDSLELAALGLNGEAGEAGEHVKKMVFHGKPLDRAALMLELSDVRWYYQLYLNCLDTSDDEIKALGIAKLTARAPERYGYAFEELTCDSPMCPEEQITCEDCRRRILMAAAGI